MDESRQLTKRLQPNPSSEDGELPTISNGEGKASSTGNALVSLKLLAEERNALSLPVIDPATDGRDKKVQRREDVVHPGILSGSKR